MKHWLLLAALVCFGSTANAASIGGESRVSSGPGSFSSLAVTTGTVLSGAAFAGVEVSTQAIGAAGAAVTAVCRTVGTFALSGGYDCSVVVSATSVVSKPNCAVAGCIPSGWTVQVPGGTGGQCIAFAICSRLQ